MKRIPSGPLRKGLQNFLLFPCPEIVPRHRLENRGDYLLFVKLAMASPRRIVFFCFYDFDAALVNVGLATEAAVYQPEPPLTGVILDLRLCQTGFWLCCIFLDDRELHAVVVIEHPNH
jgi:hypothetical protein